MQALLHPLLTFVLLYKYAALFLITFLASVAVPVPSGAILVACFVFASQGYLSVPWVAAIGVVGNVAGDILIFWVARVRGDRWLRKIGLRRLLESSAVRSIEEKMTRHPIPTVFFSRFTTTLTPLVNVMTGMTRMRFRTFLIVDVFGEAGMVGVNYVYGVMFGNNWTYFSQVFGRAGVIAVSLALLAILLLWKRAADGRRRIAMHQKAGGNV